MLKKFIDRKTEAYKKLDPERIYIENIRAFFGISYGIAKLLCEMAVKEGVFGKKYGLVCPNCGRIIKSYDSTKNFPKDLECEICESLDLSYRFNLANIEVKPFYRLLKRV